MESKNIPNSNQSSQRSDTNFSPRILSTQKSMSHLKLTPNRSAWESPNPISSNYQSPRSPLIGVSDRESFAEKMKRFEEDNVSHDYIFKIYLSYSNIYT